MFSCLLILFEQIKVFANLTVNLYLNRFCVISLVLFFLVLQYFKKQQFFDMGIFFCMEYENQFNSYICQKSEEIYYILRKTKKFDYFSLALVKIYVIFFVFLIFTLCAILKDRNPNIMFFLVVYLDVNKFYEIFSQCFFLIIISITEVFSLSC